jgi:glycosyltransferase involved in cell wall biosynthesis
MSRKTITFLYMSKAYRNISKGNEGLMEIAAKDIITSKGSGPFTTSNYFDLLNELSKSDTVECVNYVFLMSENWMRSFCNGRTIGRKDISNKFKMHYTYNSNKLKIILNDSDLVIIRGNYSEWNVLLKYINCNYIFLPCWARISPNNLKIKLNKKRASVWVDEKDTRSLFSKEDYVADIFKKPAMGLFYSNLSNFEKTIDLSLVCSKTDRKHKRVGLYIDSLSYLDKITKNKINAVIVGDSSFHKNIIDSSSFNMINLSAAYDGKRTSKAKIIDILDTSRLSVCTSSVDANPRVIVESLARNVPVLCASDLGGGKFQINKKTGLIFNPNPEDLAKKMALGLSQVNAFSPRENCIKISDTVSQILKLLI